MSEEQVVDMEQTIANMTQNQAGLVKENTRQRQMIEDLQAGRVVPMIYGKMLAIKKDIGSVGKDQKNAGQGWKFRGIDQFINSLHPILNRHGVGITTKVVQSSEAKFMTNEKTGRTTKNTQIIMEYTFFAEDGSHVSSQMPAEGVDAGDKGINKALSAAFKYALIQTFCVPTEDMAEADSGNSTVDDDYVASASKKPTATPKKAPAKKSFRKVKVEAPVDDGDEL